MTAADNAWRCPKCEKLRSRPTCKCGLNVMRRLQQVEKGNASLERAVRDGDVYINWLELRKIELQGERKEIVKQIEDAQPGKIDERTARVLLAVIGRKLKADVKQMRDPRAVDRLKPSPYKRPEEPSE